VMVYFVPNPLVNTVAWVPLPYQFLDGSGNFYYDVAYQTSVGSIELDYFFNQIVASATIPTLSNYDIPTYQFKFVVITGTSMALMLKNHIDFKDYKSVARITGMWQQDRIMR
jgi:hypothetical protein